MNIYFWSITEIYLPVNVVFVFKYIIKKLFPNDQHTIEKCNFCFTYLNFSELRKIKLLCL